jgi:hypothetical protein
MTPVAILAPAKGLSPTGTDQDMDNVLAAATPGGIEAQEKRGQVAFVAQQTLPKDGLDRYRAALEKAGFKFGEDADDLFIRCEFPAGWTKQPSDHSMWSYLLDEKGRRRGGLFYKAAFYDRKAHISLDSRYTCGTDYDAPEREDRKRRVVVKDCGTVIFASEYVDYRQEEAEYAKCEAWLSERFPECRDVGAYWD